MSSFLRQSGSGDRANMWAEIVLVLAVFTRVKINGLQNDLDTGFSYSQPYQYSSSTIKAPLAYYVSIPANQKAADHFYLFSSSNLYTGTTPQDFGGNSINYGIRGLSHRQLRPPRQPNQNVNSFNAERKIYSCHQNRIYPLRGAGTQSPLPLPDHKDGGYVYSLQKSIEEILPQNYFNSFTNQQHRQTAIPSQKLIPPSYTPHVTLQIDHQGSVSNQYRIVQSEASLPMSLNFQLPFPIGVVPIKFRALPLKTHLRQEGLLPITSYQAMDS